MTPAMHSEPLSPTRPHPSPLAPPQPHPSPLGPPQLPPLPLGGPPWLQVIALIVALITGSIEWAKGNPAKIQDFRAVQNAM